MTSTNKEFVNFRRLTERTSWMKYSQKSQITVKFNLGDEEVTDTHPAPPFLSSDQITPSGMA
jgi:hypothetical protein